MSPAGKSGKQLGFILSADSEILLEIRGEKKACVLLLPSLFCDFWGLLFRHTSEALSDRPPGPLHPLWAAFPSSRRVGRAGTAADPRPPPSHLARDTWELLSLPYPGRGRDP